MSRAKRTFQVIGEVIEQGISSTPAIANEQKVPEEDISLVMDQTGRTHEEAEKALKECGGQPAEAILKLMSS